MYKILELQVHVLINGVEYVTFGADVVIVALFVELVFSVAYDEFSLILVIVTISEV